MKIKNYKKNNTYFKLLEEALKAQKNAYAPYSHFKVGAAILDSKNKIHTGCNIENASFGATVCAERNAVAAMIASGSTEIKEVVVVTKHGWLPCGICRQVLLEFTKNPSEVLIHISTPKKYLGCYPLSELIPQAFNKKNLKTKV
jgi:cytidine deaminase